MQRQADLVSPPQCNSSDQEAGIRQISNFPIKFLLMLMGAMPFGSISVCKLEEADEEEEEGVLRVEGGEEEERKRGSLPQLCLCLSLAGLPGSEATEAGLLLLASSGSLYKHSARRRIDNKHPQFLQNAKNPPTGSGPPDLAMGQFFAFFQSCVHLGRMAVASMAGGKLGRCGGRVGAAGQARGWSASPRLLLVSGLARRHPPAASAPNIASSKQPTGPAVDAAWPARNVCIGSPPVACLVYLFTIGCHPSSGPAGLPSKQDDTAKGALPLNKANQW